MFLPNVYHQPFAPTKLESMTDCAEALSADLTLFEYGAGIGNVVNPLFRVDLGFSCSCCTQKVERQGVVLETKPFGHPEWKFCFGILLDLWRCICEPRIRNIAFFRSGKPANHSSYIPFIATLQETQSLDIEREST